ncbi:MAG: cytochrome c oxidase assembly protein [Actinomycetes bacterium]
MVGAAIPAWQPHPEVWLLVAALVASYAILAVRRGPFLVPPGQPPVTKLQIASFSLGAATVLLASDWPVHDVAEGSMYSVHMVQHLLFTLLAAPLLLMGTPGWMMRLVLPGRLLRVVQWWSRFLPALVLFNVMIVVTHWPAVVDLALRSAPFHFTIHAALLLSAFVIWMPILSPLPEVPRLTAPMKIVFLFLQSVVPTVPATFLTFGSRPLYRRYAELPKLWGIDPLNDQLIAGLIMKIGAGLFIWSIIAVIFFRWAAAEELRNRPDRALREMDRELIDMGLRQ